MIRNKALFIFLSAVLLLASCDGDSIPKPRGYFRIDLPEKKYSSFQSECPYTFNYPQYADVEPYRGSMNERCWFNIEYKRFKGTVHLSYYGISGDLAKHIEDSRALAYKHSVKANAIDEKLISYPERKVYGLLYEISGNAASSVQFYLTDSTTNFVRAALYFKASPNFDSIAPVQEFVRADIDTLIKSFRWK